MRTRFAIILLSLLCALGAGTSGSGAAAAAPGRAAGTDELAKLSGADFEIAFMSMMIPHHQSALDMAKMVPDRARHAELKTTAQTIVSSQSGEITQMTGWLRSWYGTAPQARWQQAMEQDMAGMGMPTDMQKLMNLTGDAFDQQFLQSMSAHHAMAVSMAELVATRATHAELKTLAQNIITSQSSEIKEFSGWMQAWYNQALPGSMAGGTMAGGTMAGGTMAGGTMAGGSGSTMPQTGQPPQAPFWLLWASLAGLALAGGAWLRARGRSAP